MARTLPPKAIFVLNAIGITAAIALTSDSFHFAAPALSQLPPVLSQLQSPFANLEEAYPTRQ